MNRKGQTLIIFIFLIPVFVLVAALVVDIGLMNTEFQKYRGIIDDGIRAYFEENEKEDLEKLLELNEIEKNNYQIYIRDNKIEVEFETKINSIFGKIINLNEYEIKIKRVGEKIEERVVIQKKE